MNTLLNFKDPIRITDFLRPNTISKTVYGVITNREWLIRERARLETAGRECRFVRKKDNYGHVWIALECVVNRKNS